jgi:ubiquinone/menaquinone biosynthesis C-methylase UbiE
MLLRQLEPEVMDTAEEARDYDAMDHLLVNRAFVGDFLDLWDGRGTVLDVGTGTAQIPVELCRQHATVRVVAVDLAAEMLQVARRNVERLGLGHRITLERADAKGLPFPDGEFAAVVSNSIVHHIPEPRRVLAEMVRVLRPGGTLFVRDLLRPPDEAALEALVATHAAGATAHQKKMFADSLRAALTLREVCELVSSLDLDPRGVRQTSDRHWTWSASQP